MTHAASLSKSLLWVEFALLFLIAPLVMAILLPPTKMFPMLFAVTAVGITLLHRTPHFHWRDLTDGVQALRSLVIALTCAAVATASWITMALVEPKSLFILIRERPHIMAIIILFYPLVSALPQENLFRTLYFRRYSPILPTRGAIMLNAALFSFAHLMYWSWIVALFTFAGGWLFAWSYVEKRSFPLAVILHSLCGIILFAFGMGIYFYSGNVQRPF